MISYSSRHNCFNGFTNLSQCSDSSAEPHTDRVTYRTSILHPLNITQMMAPSRHIKYNRSFSQQTEMFYGKVTTKLRLSKSKYAIPVEDIQTDHENKNPNYPPNLSTSIYCPAECKSNNASVNQSFAKASDARVTQNQAHRREAVKAMDKSLFVQAGIRERKSSVPLKVPHFGQELIKKVTQVQAGSSIKRKKSINIDTSDSCMVNHKAESRRVLAVDKELEMKHELAQQIIELINENERTLIASDSKLTAYLSRTSQSKSTATSCLKLVDSLEKDWMSRFKNIAKVFELINSKRDSSEPADLLLTFFKTPKSLSKTFDFSHQKTHGTSNS